jgi:hypothetical protein
VVVAYLIRVARFELIEALAHRTLTGVVRIASRVLTKKYSACYPEPNISGTKKFRGGIEHPVHDDMLDE